MSSQEINQESSQAGTSQEETSIEVFERKTEMEKKTLKALKETRQRQREDLLLEQKQVLQQTQKLESLVRKKEILNFQLIDEISDIKNRIALEAQSTASCYTRLLSLHESEAKSFTELQDEYDRLREDSLDEEKFQAKEREMKSLTQTLEKLERKNNDMHKKIMEDEDEIVSLKKNIFGA